MKAYAQMPPAQPIVPEPTPPLPEVIPQVPLDSSMPVKINGEWHVPNESGEYVALVHEAGRIVLGIQNWEQVAAVGIIAALIGFIVWRSSTVILRKLKSSRVMNGGFDEMEKEVKENRKEIKELVSLQKKQMKRDIAWKRRYCSTPANSKKPECQMFTMAFDEEEISI